MGARAKTAYLLRSVNEGSYFAFVPHPSVSGAWCKVPAAVLFEDCPVCKRKKGVPCKGQDSDAITGKHYSRGGNGHRSSYRLKFQKRGVDTCVAVDLPTLTVIVCQTAMNEESVE